MRLFLLRLFFGRYSLCLLNSVVEVEREYLRCRAYGLPVQAHIDSKRLYESFVQAGLLPDVREKGEVNE